MKAQIKRLSRLPRLPDPVLEGGTRTLPAFVREGGEAFQPRVALWADAYALLVRGSDVIGTPRGDGIAETLKALIGTFTSPIPAPHAEVIEGLRALTGGPRGQKLAHLPRPQPSLPARRRCSGMVMDAGLPSSGSAAVPGLR